MPQRLAFAFASLFATLSLGVGMPCAAYGSPAAKSLDAGPAGWDAQILVDDRPLPRYAHAGRWYVEALKGREYAIRLYNPYPVRVAVALSVDGLNTIDARETAARDARKWVIQPYGSVTIRGWQTSQREARHFEFTTEARSYGEALGKTSNLGVITAVFFKERPPVILPETTDRFRTRPMPAAPSAGRPAPSAASPSENSADASAERGVESDGATAQAKRADEFAATGMGRRTDHFVTQVSMELEDAPTQTVNIRYEFRAQLVRLGILPRHRVSDPLDRREGAQGFTPGFAPVPAPFR